MFGWLFRKKANPSVVVEQQSDPVRDPREVLMEEFRRVESELARLDQDFRALRFRYFSMSSDGATKLCVSDALEGRRVLERQHEIFRQRDRLAPRRAELLRAFATHTTGVSIP